MPNFYIDSLNISPSEFIDACSNREVLRLIEVLREDGYLGSEALIAETNATHDDIMYIEALIKLAKNRHRLTIEEEEIIKNISNRL